MSDNGIRTGHWIADGGDVNIPLGFIPDFIHIVDINAGSTLYYDWFQRMESDLASGSQEGISDSGGTKALLADAAGIKAYNTGTQSPTVNEWTSTRATNATARSATASGTFLKATVGALNNVGQVVDREAIFECVTAGTSSGTEPTWPSRIGGQVLDSDVRFEMVNEARLRIGYQGVTVADDIQSDGRTYMYLALKAHDSVEHGDVDGWPSGVDDNWS